MTAQIEDIYRYGGKPYTVTALSEPTVFHPQDYGLIPHSSGSTCWRGYWCEYEIADDRLYLQDLYLYNRDGNYPDCNGIPSTGPKYKKADFHSELSYVLATAFHHHRYADINLFIPYSGRILAGANPLGDYSINMGFQRPFAYETLIEFIFEEGILLATVNQSDAAKQFRASIDLNDLKWQYGSADIEQFVEDSFSLDYRKRAWWLEGG